MKIKDSIIYKVGTKIDLFKYFFDLECRKHGIFSSQFFAVDALFDNDGITQSELAKRLDVSRPSVSKTVLLLEKNQLVQIKSSPNDSRASQIFLTPKARRIYPKICEIWHQMEVEFLTDFTQTEKILLGHLVEKFKS